MLEHNPPPHLSTVGFSLFTQSKREYWNYSIIVFDTMCLYITLLF